MRDLIKKILREELTPSVKRRIDFSNIDSIIKKHRIGSFHKEEPTELGMATNRTIHKAMYDIMPREFEDYGDDYHKVWDEIKQYLNDNYGEELRQYFEKRQRDAEEDKNPLGIKYIFVKHDKPYYDSRWRGFADGFDSFDEMLTKYGSWVDIDWDVIKKKLDNINEYPEPTFADTMNSRPLKISSIGDEGNTWGYNFSIIKQIPKDNVDKVKDIQTEESDDELDEYARTLKNARKQGSGLRFPKSAIKSNPLRFRPYNRKMVDETDPKVGTGKKPEGSDRRLYTDENPNDTVSVKFRTKEDIVDSLNKQSFKSKSHKRQSQIINLIHQRVRAAYQNAKDPETKERLKRGLDYIEGRKEASKKKTGRLNKLKEFEGDSNRLNLPHIDTWHDGQYKAQDGKTKEAIKLMTKAADEAKKYAKETQDDGINGEAAYYMGTIAWLEKDYPTVEKYINDDNVKITGNDEVLKKLLKNKDKSYKEAYNFPEQNEGLHDTSWENDKGDKITLMDLLNATENIPVEKISVEELKPYLLSWDGDEEERGKIDKADLQYPILIFVDNDGSFISIIDGHHRAQKAVRKGLETIKAKVIPINSLPKDIRKVFGHMGRQEEMKEGELTERCWTGYTQKGMKTMFGKRYPNCVKIKKK